MNALNRFLVVALAAGLAAGTASAQTRMQVTGSTPIRARAEVSAPQLAMANPGEIVFVLSTSGTFSAIEPPERVGLWVNRDFIEGNRVIAKTVQLRTGPGLEHDVAGSLARGAAIMKISEQGEWLQISPPSSSQVYVLSSMLKAVPVVTEPIGEVETVTYEPPAAPVQVATVQPVAPVVASAAAPVVAAPPPPPPAQTAAPTPKIAPSTPGVEPVKKPIDLPAPIPPERIVATSKPMPAAPVTQQPPVVHPAQPAARPIRPAVSGSTPAQPVSVPGAVLRQNPPARPAAAPAAASLPAVDETYVRQLTLDPATRSQGKRVRVSGELRQDPFRSKSPSRFCLLSREDGSLEVLCDVHGDSAQLRPFIGKRVMLRGQAYRIEGSDVPVVVIGQVQADGE